MPHIFFINTNQVSTNELVNFLSVAITTPSLAQIPSDVLPLATAFKAYSICSNLPVRENVVKEKLYAESPILVYSVRAKDCIMATVVLGFLRFAERCAAEPR